MHRTCHNFVFFGSKVHYGWQVRQNRKSLGPGVVVTQGLLFLRTGMCLYQWHASRRHAIYVWRITSDLCRK